MKLDAFLLGVMNFLDACRAFRPRTAINAVDLFRAEPQDARRIHRSVAGADHRDSPSSGIGVVSNSGNLRAHQIAARQQLVGGQNTVQRVAWNPEHRRVAGAGADKHGVMAHLVDHLGDREQASDQRVAYELHAELAQVFYLSVDDFVWQPEVRMPYFNTPPA